MVDCVKTRTAIPRSISTVCLVLYRDHNFDSHRKQLWPYSVNRLNGCRIGFTVDLKSSILSITVSRFFRLLFFCTLNLSTHDHKKNIELTYLADIKTSSQRILNEWVWNVRVCALVIFNHSVSYVICH